MTGLDLILSRLPQLPRKTPARAGVARAYRACCPVCGGHGMPLSLAETDDSIVLLNCHASCLPGEVLSAIGLSWTDVLPARPIAHRIKGNGGPHAWASTYSCAERTLKFLEKAFVLLATANKPQDETAFEEYLKAVFEAADQIQQFKKFMRVAVRAGGNVK